MATTTGTALYTPTMNELFEEAFERCGCEMRTGYDFKTARRSLNLLTMEWASRGINLWTLEQGTLPLVQGTATYDLPADTVDLVDHVLRTGTGSTQSDISLNRISVDTYASIPNKNVQDRPLQLWINRRSGVANPTIGVQYPQLTLWPVPDQNSYYTLVYWRLRRIQDAGTGANVEDVPFRFVPALVAGLAYHLSFKVPGGMDRMLALKQVYDEQWGMAQDEDREKAPLRIVPRMTLR